MGSGISSPKFDVSFEISSVPSERKLSTMAIRRRNAWITPEQMVPSVELLEKILEPFPNGVCKLRHFDVLRTLGTGNFGRVKMVHVKKNKTPFALKCISKWKMTSEWGQIALAARALKREIEILKRARNPFIVNFFRCFHDDEYAYILMEFINGGEISMLSPDSYLSVDTMKFLSAELIIAVGALHSKGVIYRDLKPPNVLLDSTGHIKIIDFGLAKVIGDSMTRTVCGTLSYQAPELILLKAYTYPVDWWAVGCVIFELQTKTVCFHGNDSFSIQQRILSLSVRWPRAAKTPRKLRDLAYRFLQMDPNKRDKCKEALKRPFLKFIHMESLNNRSQLPPYKLTVPSPTDTSQFDKAPELGVTFPPLAVKEKHTWNNELTGIMSFQDT